MAYGQERDFPPGHPKAFDYDPNSDEAKVWAKMNVHPLGERDWPVNHPAAIDTPGNKNHLRWAVGVDPFRPELEAHTGRTPEQAEAVAEFNRQLTAQAHESPVLEPTIAPEPPHV